MSAENKNRGFSLLEVMISLVVLLIVTGVVFYAMAYYQRSYGSTRLRAVMHEGVRGAVDLMSQEVGQAGVLDFTTRLTSAAITASLTPQTVTLNSVSSIFVGEDLIVDTNATEESVKVTAVDAGASTITAVFNLSHAANTIIRASGVFPQGILSSSTATELRIFGDINADGNITYVKYVCNPSAGTLSRSMTVVTPGTTTANASEVLVSDLIPNPGSTPCFQYTSKTAGPYTFVTSVAITLSARSSKLDPQTKQYATMTKSFVNLAPRNVLLGLALALSGSEVRLQPTPPNIPLT
jgi:prepilin-type N-terminal cleavage/methylation domain-containing protein